MTILNQEPIISAPAWTGTVIILSFAALFIFLTLLCASMEHKCLGLGTVSCILVMISIITLVSALAVPSVPDGRNRYEVILDDTVSAKEIHEKYIVVEQRGDIWVLEDKVKDE